MAPDVQYVSELILAGAGLALYLGDSSSVCMSSPTRSSSSGTSVIWWELTTTPFIKLALPLGMCLPLTPCCSDRMLFVCDKRASGPIAPVHHKT